MGHASTRSHVIGSDNVMHWHGGKIQKAEEKLRSHYNVIIIMADFQTNECRQRLPLLVACIFAAFIAYMNQKYCYLRCSAFNCSASRTSIVLRNCVSTHVVRCFNLLRKDFALDRNPIRWNLSHSKVLLYTCFYLCLLLLLPYVNTVNI